MLDDDRDEDEEDDDDDYEDEDDEDFGSHGGEVVLAQNQNQNRTVDDAPIRDNLTLFEALVSRAHVVSNVQPRNMQSVGHSLATSPFAITF